ncbi:MAG TPA: RNHCP domain-containing protein [Rickettsiales bacterium]|nr:RNHCP domain-containing protein [Rickettsiales bacterium]
MKKFTRTIEDFICENCGTKVKGDGYTNHCPNCLYSKHVDINPGDRMSSCGGLMKPIEILQKNGEFVILHKCEKCGFEKKNKVSEKDNIKEIIKISNSK